MFSAYSPSHHEHKKFNFVIVKGIVRYIIFSALVMLAMVSQAQQGSNPFEIIRGDEQSTESSSSPTRAQQPQNRSNNAFEVFREDDVATPVQPTNPAVDTTDTDLIENTSDGIDIQNGEVDIDDNNMDYMSDNPFEVSHIPYRRSELKEQAKSNKATTNKPSNNKRSIVNVSSTSNTFIFWLVLFTLLLLAIVVNVQRNAISKVVKSITNENVLKLSKREENGGLTGHYIMLYVVFFINLACFIYLIAKHYSGYDGFSNWLLVFIAVAAVYLIRHISMMFIGQIFDISKDSSLYSFTIMTFNIFLGLVLIPINLVVAFSPSEIGRAALYVGIGLILILLLIRLVRGLLIGVRFIGEHLFQFFLYLCTFEIAPILILLRILGDQ